MPPDLLVSDNFDRILAPDKADAVQPCRRPTGDGYEIGHDHVRGSDAHPMVDSQLGIGVDVMQDPLNAR